MNLRRFGAGDFRRERWKNDGGFTTELARHDEGGRWTWRVSIAEVERDGPFSDFSGCERTIALLQGDGMELCFDGRGTVRLDRVHEPFSFDGGWQTGCRLLGGPVRDLNLIAVRARARGSMAFVPAHACSTLELSAPWTLFLCIAGTARIEAAGEEFLLERGELLRVDAGDGTLAALHGGADTLIVQVRIVRA